MKNRHLIGEVCRSLMRACEQVESYTGGMECFGIENKDLAETYSGFRMDELERVQILTLKLTELITSDEPDANTDSDAGGAFFPGDLDVKKVGSFGEKESKSLPQARGGN